MRLNVNHVGSACSLSHTSKHHAPRYCSNLPLVQAAVPRVLPSSDRVHLMIATYECIWPLKWV